MSHSNNDPTWQHSEKESALAFRSIHANHPSLLMLDCIICIILSGIYLVCMQHDAWMQISGRLRTPRHMPMTVTQMK